MTGEMGCEQVTELASELALGIAAGQDRDVAPRHLSGCPACRKLVAELSCVGDELLLLAPEQQPPLGFESRVLTAIAEPPPPRGRRALPRGWLPRGRRWVAVVAAAVLAAAIGAGSVLVATADDRQLAQGYRAVLREGQGSTFAAAPLGDRRVGSAPCSGTRGSRPGWS